MGRSRETQGDTGRSREITIVMCYFQLCAEDYNWWWRSFLTAGSSGLYLFLYSMVRARGRGRGRGKGRDRGREEGEGEGEGLGGRVHLLRPLPLPLLDGAR